MYTTQKSWDGSLFSRIQISYGDGLVFIGEIMNNTLSQDVEWPTEKNRIGGQTDNVNLKI